MIQINKELNRIQLKLIAFDMGKDMCIILTGGEPHVGSVTFGSKGISTETFVIGEHKEYVLTEKLGKILKERYLGTFVICCGVHLDNITKEEIAEIMNLSCQLIEELCLKLKAKE